MSYRILKSIKNRYGSTNEICILEMSDDGLREIKNPSEIFLDKNLDNTSGTCVTCLIEGGRPFFVEVQALITKSYCNPCRRVVSGFDYNRLCLIIAVIEKRTGLFFYNMDVYLNIAGGFRLNEPVADLAIATALISALKNIDVKNLVAFGEIDLSGKIRHAPQFSNRINEINRLGFKECLVSSNNEEVSKKSLINNVKINKIKNIKEILFYLKQ